MTSSARVSSVIPAPANLVTNGGFELGLANWRPLWCRQADAGKIELDGEFVHMGKNAVRITHKGENDWSFEPLVRLPVQRGDIYELKVWVKLEGTGSATLCASTWDAKGQNLDWSHGERSTGASDMLKQLTSRIVVPEGVAELQPRIGHGPATIWLDDCSLVKAGSIDSLRPAGLPGDYSRTSTLSIFKTLVYSFTVLVARSDQKDRVPARATA